MTAISIRHFTEGIGLLTNTSPQENLEKPAGNFGKPARTSLSPFTRVRDAEEGEGQWGAAVVADAQGRVTAHRCGGGLGWLADLPLTRGRQKQKDFVLRQSWAFP